MKNTVPISTLPRLPRNMKIKAGVNRIPNKLATAVFTTAAASFPDEFTVNTTADDIVVGRHSVINNPSNKYGDNEVIAFKIDTNAIPMHG